MPRCVGAVQRVDLLVGQGRSRRRDPVAGGEQIREHLLRGQFRPQRVDRSDDVGVRTHLGPDVVDVLPAQQVRAAERIGSDDPGELVGQGVDDPVHEDRPGQVVGSAGRPGATPRAGHHLAVEGERVGVEAQLHGGAGHLLPVADGLLEHLHHVQGALELAGHGIVLDGRRDPRIQIPDRRQQHAGLTERGQHLTDVVEEAAVRAHDEHAALGQLLSVGVEQVGRAVQRDRGLAGARTALDDEDTAMLGPDDRVLLGLDRRHDVVHLPGARGVQSGKQRGFSGHATGRRGVGVLEGGVEVEVLVVQCGDGAAAAADVATQHDTVGRGGGREVERTRLRRAPVEQQRLVVVVLVEDAEAADVADLRAVLRRGSGGVRPVVPHVDAAEAQAVLGGVVLRDVLGVHVGVRLAFAARLRGASGLAQHAGQPGLRVLAQTVEMRVEHRHVGLLAIELRMGRAINRHRDSSGIDMTKSLAAAEVTRRRKCPRSLVAAGGKRAESLITAVRACDSHARPHHCAVPDYFFFSMLFSSAFRFFASFFSAFVPCLRAASARRRAFSAAT